VAVSRGTEHAYAIRAAIRSGSGDQCAFVATPFDPGIGAER
jgi:hypothetical protein